MNLNEWKETQSRKRIPQYTHFDYRVSLESCFDYVTSPEKVARHGFCPFIHYIIKSRKVKNGIKCAPKERQIYYAAHLDSWIYRYYSYLINEVYNKRVKEDGIDGAAVAYRTDLGKSNIHFAKEAFDHMRSLESCYVLIGDFTNFFDNLNHAYLKERLCDLLSVSSLSDDFYAVFKNVTRFSYVELHELLELKSLKDTRRGRKDFNSCYYKRAMSPEEFRTRRKNDSNFIKSNPNRNDGLASDSGHYEICGVPQGSPISAVLANVYMLSADKELNEYVLSRDGFYMRYSDDFIIVLPGDVDFYSRYEDIKKLLSDVPNLTLEKSKTKLFYFDGETVENCTGRFISDQEEGKNIIEFLGFAFDGKSICIRDKTISKYYNRMYGKLKTIVKYGNLRWRKQNVSAKHLYEKYSYKGSRGYQMKQARKKGILFDEDNNRGNFHDYVRRAQMEFVGEPIDTVTKRHMGKIRKRLKGINRN